MATPRRSALVRAAIIQLPYENVVVQQDRLRKGRLHLQTPYQEHST